MTLRIYHYRCHRGPCYTASGEQRTLEAMVDNMLAVGDRRRAQGVIWFHRSTAPASNIPNETDI